MSIKGDKRFANRLIRMITNFISDARKKGCTIEEVSTLLNAIGIISKYSVPYDEKD